jgi:hypothetical protein
MKKTLLTLTAIAAILFSTAATSVAQERKPEQKVRMIMHDKSCGVAKDTVYNLNRISDTLKLSGSKIYVYKEAKTGELKLVVKKCMHGKGPMPGEQMEMEIRREMKMVGKDSIGPGGEHFMIMRGEGNMGNHPDMQGRGMMPGCCGKMHPEGMMPPQANKDVVFYNLSINGVMVSVTAPKEKEKEVNLIINDIQKILNTEK